MPTHESLSACLADDVFSSFVDLVLALRGSSSFGRVPLPLLLCFGTLQKKAKILSIGGERKRWKESRNAHVTH